jgi:mono/diheme cytochrome c family protein
LAVLVGLGVLVLVAAPRADAKQKFMSGFGEAFPAAAGSPLDSCLLCHTDPVRPREENLNSYGEDWEDIGDKDYLAPNLLDRDSDGDGVTNGQEIEQLSLPGDPASSAPPSTTTTISGTPPDGQALYASRCAACHGPDGGDLSATPLDRATFITITLNGQGGMPAIANLSADEAGAIWDYVTGAVPATTTTTTTLPGVTTTTTLVASGATVWAQHCAACHGANGGNVVPTSLSRAELISVITNGIGSMRGFPELGSAQIGNLADYMLALSIPTTTLPGATTTTTLPRSGAAVYDASCAMCHGPGGGNLQGHTLSFADIVSITANGVGTMRGYAGELSSAEIDTVAAYIAALTAPPGATTTTAPPGSPVSGSTLYMQNCSGCHGLHGEGGPGGPVAGTTLGRSEVIAVTEAGTTGMPGYGSQLSAAEIAAIADWLVAFPEGLVAGQVPAIQDETGADDEAAVSTDDEQTDGHLLSVGDVAAPLARGVDDRTDGGVTAGLVLAVVSGLLIAGGAVSLWMRAGRNLVGD